MVKYLTPNIWGGKQGDSPGIGHEFRLWLTGYNMADYYNLKFVHSPFIGDHVEPPENWIKVGRVDVPVSEWEPFLNFGQGELQHTDLPNDIRVIDLPKITCHFPVDNQQFSHIINKNKDNNEPILFKCPFNQFLSMRWNIYRTNRFKNKYWSKRQEDPIDTSFANDCINVAVHIRRCDVTPQRYPTRFVPNTYYKKIISQILDVYPDAQIHVYSDAASTNEFPELTSLPNMIFHLRTDIFQTFHSIVSADIYVTCVGSWTILTSFLSKGVKITKAWNAAWNNFPTDDQMIVPASKDGTFNTNRLMKGVEITNATKND